MTTFDMLVEETNLLLSGYSGNQDQVTHITGSLAPTGLTVTVNDASVVTPGLVEIGSELLWVQSVNTGTSTVTFAPFGRGYRGTTAGTYASGAKLTVAPVMPRAVLERAINATILGTWPTLYGTGVEEFPYLAAIDTYELPAGAERVLSVSWEAPGPSGEWLPVRRWDVQQNANTTDYPTGNTITIYDHVMPQHPVRVVYTKVPTALVSGNAFSVSGLRPSTWDLIQFGAAARLVPWFEVGHAPGVAAEANYTAAIGQKSSPTSLARYLTQMYQLRLQEEAAALQSLFPVRSHYTR